MARTAVQGGVLALWVVGATAALGAQIIDRVVAVVNGGIITQSDVTVAVGLGLVAAGPATDPVPAALDALIERRLMLSEVDRYAPPEPAPAAVDRRLQDIETRVGAPLGSVLRAGGLSEEQLRQHVRDDLRIEAYLQQRFGAMQPSEDEILQYYRDRLPAFSQNGVPRPFDEVHDEARAALVAQRREATIAEWVAGLRRRANVNVLPR